MLQITAHMRSQMSWSHCSTPKDATESLRLSSNSSNSLNTSSSRQSSLFCLLQLNILHQQFKLTALWPCWETEKGVKPLWTLLQLSQDSICKCACPQAAKAPIVVDKWWLNHQSFCCWSVCLSLYVGSWNILWWAHGGDSLHHVMNISLSNPLSHTQKVFICSIIGAVSSHQSIIFVITTHALFAVTQSSLCCKTQVELEFIFMGLLSNKGAIR